MKLLKKIFRPLVEYGPGAFVLAGFVLVPVAYVALAVYAPPWLHAAVRFGHDWFGLWQ